jgi:hypothetical protein
MRKTVLMAAVVALAVPSAGVADAKHRKQAGAGQAAQACKAERQSLGREAFRAKWGNAQGRRAMRRCVRAHVRAARKKCREERQADANAFRQKYGNKKGRHAMRRCIRAHAGEPADPPAQP